MSAASLEAPNWTAFPTLRGEELPAARPAAPRWRLSLTVGMLLAILLHLALVWLIVIWSQRRPSPEIPAAIPVTVVTQPPRAAKPAAPPPAPPIKPAPEPPEPPAALRESGPDQRTTVLRHEEMPPKPVAPAPPPAPAAEPAPSPTKPAATAPAATAAPAKAVPGKPPIISIGPNGFSVSTTKPKAALEPKAQQTAAAPHKPGQLSLVEPDAPGYDLAPSEITTGNGDMTGDPYLNLLRDWVNRFLPRRSDDSLGLTGRAVYRVALKRSGELASVELVRSSGIDRIDQMGESAIRRASPMPPVPSDFPGNPVYFIATVRMASF